MTLSALGIFSAAGAGGGVALSDYELIQTALVTGSSTSFVDFSSLNTYASTYKHLQIRLAARSSHSVAEQVVNLRFNSDSGSNYSIHYLAGNGSAVISSGNASQTNFFVALIPGSSATANAFGASVVDLLDCFSTTKNKTSRALLGTNPNPVVIYSGAWYNTTSVTNIRLSVADGNFVAGSRFSLYGIKG
jgi:hypothetical protein